MVDREAWFYGHIKGERIRADGKNVPEMSVLQMARVRRLMVRGGCMPVRGSEMIVWK